MRIPNTFKPDKFIAWVILNEETYKTFTTTNQILDKRIHLTNSYLLFLNDGCFVNVNSKNIMIMFGQIIQKKYE